MKLLLTSDSVVSLAGEEKFKGVASRQVSSLQAMATFARSTGCLLVDSLIFPRALVDIFIEYFIQFLYLGAGSFNNKRYLDWEARFLA